jgi:hypothetical protein
MQLTMMPATFALLCPCRMTLNRFARRSTPLRWFMTRKTLPAKVCHMSWARKIPTRAPHSRHLERGSPSSYSSSGVAASSGIWSAGLGSQAAYPIIGELQFGIKQQVK